MKILSYIFKHKTPLFIVFILLGTLPLLSQSGGGGTVYECGSIEMYGGSECSGLEIELLDWRMKAAKENRPSTCFESIDSNDACHHLKQSNIWRSIARIVTMTILKLQ